MTIQTDDFGNPLCPKCGQPLFHRNGPYGEFYGHRKGTKCDYRAKQPKLEEDWRCKQKNYAVNTGNQVKASSAVLTELGSQMEAALNKAAKKTSHYTDLQKWADEMKRT